MTEPKLKERRSPRPPDPHDPKPSWPKPFFCRSTRWAVSLGRREMDYDADADEFEVEECNEDSEEEDEEESERPLLSSSESLLQSSVGIGRVFLVSTARTTGGHRCTPEGGRVHTRRAQERTRGGHGYHQSGLHWLWPSQIIQCMHSMHACVHATPPLSRHVASGSSSRYVSSRMLLLRHGMVLPQRYTAAIEHGSM
jgi:hypothetical protein